MKEQIKSDVLGMDNVLLVVCIVMFYVFEQWYSGDRAAFVEWNIKWFINIKLGGII